MRLPPRRRQAQRPKSTLEMLAAIRRMLRATGLRVGDDRPSYLRALIDLRRDLDDAILDAVRGLRDANYTWEEIGAATGTTRQAAIMKWSAKVA